MTTYDENTALQGGEEYVKTERPIKTDEQKFIKLQCKILADRDAFYQQNTVFPNLLLVNDRDYFIIRHYAAVRFTPPAPRDKYLGMTICFVPRLAEPIVAHTSQPPTYTLELPT